MGRQAVKKKEEVPPFWDLFAPRIREAMSILLLASASLLLIALATYHTQDPGWSFSASYDQVNNKVGRIGAWMADVLLTLFGYLAYLFPLVVSYAAWLVFQARHKAIISPWGIFALKMFGTLLLLLAGTGLASLHLAANLQPLPVSAGGVLGNLVGSGLVQGLNQQGTSLLLIALFLMGVTLLTGISWIKVVDAIGKLTWHAVAWCLDKIKSIKPALNRLGQLKSTKKEAAPVPSVPERVIKAELVERVNDPIEDPSQLEFSIGAAKISKRHEAKKKKSKPKLLGGAKLPSIDCLDNPSAKVAPQVNDEALQKMARLVELKLSDFGVDAQVKEILPGPVVTRFELELAPGLKVSKVSNLAKDIARSLSITSVRVVEVIPGKSYVGIELPNQHREVVRLKEVLESRAYYDIDNPLALALGKDIAGFPSVVNLAKMPHLLVAGTTGSGKSVGLNAMLLSMLFRATPEQVRMIMIDPKMLELSIYEGIPHLLTPVVTDMNDAANALRWCVAEMESRYQLMASLGVRNITGFNAKIKEAQKKGEEIPSPFNKEGAEKEPLETLPYIVVVIDELADMMMVVGKKVEQLIARIAQKARAAGIHLILATQRPSVDVLTGLIKANIPTRISFQVSSRVDSRTILDQQGAENLLGHGDMLYLAPGTGLPMRVHGAFVDDHEVHKVVESWKNQGEPDYLDDVLEGADTSMLQEGDPLIKEIQSAEDADPLYDEAVYIVTKSRRASISSIQRRLKIGYNRAARMIEDMEAAGVVSEMQTNGSREVLAPPPPE